MQRIDAFQRRHPAAGFPLAVVYKFFDDQGNYLAALITYYGIISLFPLLLLLSTILGIVLDGDPELQRRVVDSALSQFPVIGQDLSQPKRIGGGPTGLVFGILGSLYGGLGVAQALQNAMSTTWAIPRNSRPNPIKARGRSLLLLGTVGLAVLATTALSTLGSSADAFGANVSAGLSVLLIGASVALNAGVFTLAFRIATARDVGVRDLLPGAIGAALAWQVLQSFGAFYVGRVVQNASATNGAFALVLGLIAFVYLSAVAIVLCVELNVVRVKRLYPRALLTPFTDNVDLTAGDRSAYTAQAKAQRNKGFQDIDVSFGPQPGDRESNSDPRRTLSPLLRRPTGRVAVMPRERFGQALDRLGEVGVVGQAARGSARSRGRPSPSAWPPPGSARSGRTPTGRWPPARPAGQGRPWALLDEHHPYAECDDVEVDEGHRAAKLVDRVCDLQMGVGAAAGSGVEIAGCRGGRVKANGPVLSCGVVSSLVAVEVLVPVAPTLRFPLV